MKTTDINPNITYMGLPTGSYTLCVRMLNDDGTMGEVESRLDITIGQAWFRSWWAIILYLLVAAGLCYWVQRHFKVVRKEIKEQKPE